MFFWSLELGLIQHFRYSCTFSKHCIITIFCIREIIQLNPVKTQLLQNMSVTNQKCSALVPRNQRVLLYFTFWTFCLTSKDRSFLTAQIQMPMETRDRNMRGMKTRIQEWVSASRLLQARNSNISSSRCIPVQITIALN